MTAPSPDAHERLLELSEQACRGALDAEDYIQLDALLSSSHRNQITFLEYVHLSVELETLAMGEDRPPYRVHERSRKRGVARTIAVGMSLCVAAVLTVAGLSLLSAVRPGAGRQAAGSGDGSVPWLARVQRFSGNAIWKVDGHDKGSHVFGRQSLVISEGYLELSFRNGTRLSAEGPTELVVHDDLRVSLAKGTVRATLADGVSGFQVETDTMEVVDRGTQFYVQRDRDGLTSSYVSDGVCDIRHRGENAPPAPFRTVVAGESVLVDQDRRLVPLSAEQSRKFAERLVSSFLSYELQIARTSPSVCLVAPPEGTLDHLFCSVNRPVYLIPERQNVLLREDLLLPGRNGAEGVRLAAGTFVDSFLVHNAFGPNLPAGASSKLLRQTQTTGEIVFGHEVLAVLSKPGQLVQTDQEFAAKGVRFPAPDRRGLESQDRVSPSSTDPHRVDFVFQATEGDVDQVRVLVRSGTNGGR